ncbi:MAG: LytR C-terminal domain-containing protein [bacterium]
MDGSSKGETRQFHTSEEKLWAEIQNEKQKLETWILELEYRLSKYDRDIRAIEDLIHLKKGKPQKDSAGAKSDIGTLKIKVLSGDGDIDSAHRMASHLKQMGYTVRLVDHAPTSNFTHDTVFYALRSKSEGEALVARLGGNTTLKFISWPSQYDLMVVTGKNDTGK